MGAWLAELEAGHRALRARIGGEERWTAIEDSARFRDALGTALSAAGRPAEAARLLADAVARFPGNTRLLGALAWLRATSKDAAVRDGTEAVRLAERACAVERTPDCLDTLAAAYAETGRFADASRTVRAAMDDADATPGFRDEVGERAALYDAGRPYRVP